MTQKNNFFIFLNLLLLFFIASKSIQAQPVSLHPDVAISLYLNVGKPSSCIAYEKVSKTVFYGNVTGDIYKVIEGTVNKDTLLYDSLMHGIPYLQGMAIHDSAIYVIGNDWTNGTQGIGIVSKGVLQSNGSRIWKNVLKTVLYPATNATFDHGFSGIEIDPAGQFLYISSGSRSDHGELQTAGGLFPATREVPLTSAIFKIPIATENLILPNNETQLIQGGWLFADGTRNSFGLSFNGRGDLFGVENSGDRDDQEELNRLQSGKHYGFPWMMGTNHTPQQYPGYNPANDPLANPNSKAYQLGFFYNDPTYPTPPVGITFTMPIENQGPAANYYRDSTDGKLHRAIGQSLGTFTMHRSPVGLVFDKDSLLSNDFRGSGFVLSFTQGNGDSTGFLSNSIWGLPVVPIDSSQDMMQLKLVYNVGTDTYTLNSYRIIEGFNLPVNAEIVDTTIYVLEFGETGNRHIWKVSMPSFINSVASSNKQDNAELNIFPNPTKNSFSLNYYLPNQGNVTFTISDLLGRKLLLLENETTPQGWNKKTFDSNDIGLSQGIYVIHFAVDDKSIGSKKLVVNH